LRRRYLKACGLERKGEDKITVKKKGRNTFEANKQYICSQEKKKKTSNMRNK